MEDLDEGRYYWVEIGAPEGYTIDDEKHYFNVTNGKTTRVTVENVKTAVPEVFGLDHYAYVIGYPDGTFRPNGNITRAEFAAIAARFDKNGNTTPADFSDIYGHWASEEISVAANNGWILGYIRTIPSSRISLLHVLKR